MEFLTEVAGPEMSSQLLLLRAKCEGKDSTKLLDQAVEVILSTASLHKYGPEYFVQLNPDFLIDVAKHYPENVRINLRFN